MRGALKPDRVTLLKPDRLAGTKILRGVDQVGGVQIQSSTVVFPPTMGQSPPPVLTLDEQTERLRGRLVEVTDQAGDIALTLIKFKAKFTRACRAALFRSAWIERVRIQAHLEQLGMKQAAAAIDSLKLEGT